jgi:leucyl aminopeptidase
VTVRVLACPLLEIRTDAVVVGLPAERGAWPSRFGALDRRTGGRLGRAMAAEGFQRHLAEVTHIHTGDRLATSLVVVVGLGGRRERTLEGLRRAVAAGVRRARDLGARRVAVDLPDELAPPAATAQALVEGALLGTYTFERYRSQQSAKAVERLAVVVADGRQLREAVAGARRGEITADATRFARDLVNMPANELHPTSLARVARQLARQRGLRVRVYDRVRCARLGMGAFLAVAAGSQQPPRFIHLVYRPRGAPRKRVALVGKGITFDAGGLDLKNADAMLRMKDDMSGAAAVLAVLRALPALRPPLEVHGLIAAAENMPSGSALRPGDVVRAMNGTTIEVGNTDAEGRLTLADALCYARARVRPDEIIDVATLTGACVVALGPLCAGLFASDQALADRLLAAAAAAGERLWQLPLLDEYREHLKSEVADLNNVGPRGGGAITASLFLREFVGGTPWAHLDIAGPAFSEKDLPLSPKGATGAAVRTLLAYLVT